MSYGKIRDMVPFDTTNAKIDLWAQTRPEFVYAMLSPRHIKIGRSFDPKSRLKRLLYYNYGTRRPESANNLAWLDLAGCFLGNSKDEAAIHRAMKPYRELGEWYYRTPASLRALRALGLRRIVAK